jgi:hypothetical protein
MTEPVVSADEYSKNVPRFDRFGFSDDDKRRNAAESDPKRLQAARKKEIDRTRKWLKMIKDWDRFAALKPAKLKRRIRKGIPDSVRGVVWQKLIRTNVWTEKYPDAMNTDLIRNVSKDLSDDIRKDIDRTYPRHELFCDEGGMGQSSLQKILLLYAAHDPENGYCQGMGFIAGMFLMYMSEKSAFYSLVGALEVFSRHLSGAMNVIFYRSGLFFHSESCFFRSLQSLKKSCKCLLH